MKYLTVLIFISILFNNCYSQPTISNENTRKDSMFLSNSVVTSIQEYHSLSFYNDDKTQYVYISDSIFSNKYCFETDISDVKYFDKTTNFCKLINLINLKKIRVFYNSQKEFPRCISNLKYLNCLYLIECNYDTFPEDVFYAESIDTLCFSNCSIGKFLFTNNKTIKIRYFSYSDTNMTEIPQILANFNNLRSFSIMPKKGINCSIIDTIIKRNSLIENLVLVQINLNDNIFQSILGLKNLEGLDLSHCGLSKLSSEISKIKKLNFLALQHNSLSSLPEEIKVFKDQLLYLFLEDNNFSKEEQEKIKGWLPNTRVVF